jgi:phosphomevalonate kinase
MPISTLQDTQYNVSRSRGTLTMNLLAFAGKRYSGKTQSAKIVQDICFDLGIQIRKASFADSLRAMYCKHRGIPESLLLDPNTKEEYRYDLIEFAHKCKQKDPYVFIKYLQDSIKNERNVVIDDVRSIEELQAVVTLGGFVYKIESDKHARESRGWKYYKPVDNHLSETEIGDLSGYTFFCLGGGQVFNNSNTEALKRELMPIVLKSYMNLE